MKTISSVVEEIIKEKPFLEEALSQDLINLSALARQILPQVEEALRKEIKEGAIVMALKRLSPVLQFEIEGRIKEAIKSLGDITVRSNLADYTYKNSDTLITKQSMLLDKISMEKDIFYTFSQGVYETTMIMSNTMEKKLEEYFRSEQLISKMTDLASITIKLPTINSRVSGLYYFIFKKIAWEGINLLEVVSTTNEFTLIVREEDVDRAFSVIKKLSAR